MLFFDIDDTLLDYQSSEHEGAIRFARRFQTELRKPFSAVEAFPKAWQAISQLHMQRYLDGEISFQQQRRKRIRAVMARALTDQQADELFQHYHQQYQAAWQLFDDVLPCLNRLAHLRLGVITNGDAQQQQNKLQQLGIAEFFELVVTPADSGHAKPHDSIFRYAAQAAGLPAAECIYVGDDYQKDYLGAQQAGWQAVWLDRHCCSREAAQHKEKKINSLEKLAWLEINEAKSKLAVNSSQFEATF